MAPVLAQLVLSVLGSSTSVPILHLAPSATSIAARAGCVSCKFSPAYETTQRYAAADWAKNIRTLPQSIVLKRIASPLIFNVVVTTIICAINPIFTVPRLISLPHTLLGSALGLLLVFRTNAAYDRFWEARKRWDVVTAECRNFASLACTFMTAGQALPILSLISVFPVVLKNYLRSSQSEAGRRRAGAAKFSSSGRSHVKTFPEHAMWYVYIIRSINSPDQEYTGATRDLKQRLSDHNSGKSTHTSKFAPWELRWYCAFPDKYKALDFEKYLKSASGRAFAKKRL